MGDVNTPLQFASPDVQLREIDSSSYSRGPSLTTAGFLGVFQKGPFTPTLVQSLAEAQRIFGGYLAPSVSYAMYALKQFFENGGRQAMVLRTAHYTDPTDADTLAALKATVTLKDRAGTPLDTLKVDALSEGAWANGAAGGLSVAVLAATVSTSDFRLQVLLNGAIVEDFDNINLDSTSTDYAIAKVNRLSQYVRLTQVADVTASPNNLPALTANTDLAGGADGLTGLVDADFVGAADAKTGLYAFDDAQIDLLVVPGKASGTVGQAMLTYAATRQDCFALLETPDDDVDDAIAYRNQSTPYTGSAFDSSYGALVAPWVQMIDPVTQAVMDFPPAGAVAGAIAASDATGGPWQAPAGQNTGAIIGVLGLATKMSQSTINKYFQAGINCIVRKQDQYLLWGQNTLQRKATATDRINVRRTLIYIERALKILAQGFLYKPNTTQTWQALLRAGRPFLQGVKDAQGIVDFALICDDKVNTPQDIAAHRLNVVCAVKPAIDIEFITINVNIVDQSVDLQETFGN